MQKTAGKLPQLTLLETHHIPFNMPPWPSVPQLKVIGIPDSGFIDSDLLNRLARNNPALNIVKLEETKKQFGRFDEAPPDGEMPFGAQVDEMMKLLVQLGLNPAISKLDYVQDLMAVDLRKANRDIHINDLLPFTRLAHIFYDGVNEGMTTWAGAGFPNLSLVLQPTSGGNVEKLFLTSEASLWDVAVISMDEALQLFGNFDLTPEEPPAGELSYQEQISLVKNQVPMKRLVEDKARLLFALDLGDEDFPADFPIEILTRLTHLAYHPSNNERNFRRLAVLPHLEILITGLHLPPEFCQRSRLYGLPPHHGLSR